MQYATEMTAEFKTREQATYEALRRAIIQGRWGQDEPLVVSRIAGELGVSRITIANALKRLAGEGFVQLTPHKEAVVTPFEPKSIREIYLMRAELEALATWEAVGHIKQADLDDLQRLNLDIGHRKSAPDPDIREVRAADLTFHRRLRTVADMPFLAQTLGNLADRCEGYRAKLLDAHLIAMPGPERHTDLLAALAARDAAAAAESMRRHVLAGMEAVLAVLARPSAERQDT